MSNGVWVAWASVSMICVVYGNLEGLWNLDDFGFSFGMYSTIHDAPGWVPFQTFKRFHLRNGLDHGEDTHRASWKIRVSA